MIDIRWATLARDDFERIVEYHRDIDPTIAVEIGRKIVAATAFLRERPHAGPVSIAGDRRKWRIGGTRYIVFYRVAEAHVRILRVLHSSQAQTDP